MFAPIYALLVNFYCQCQVLIQKHCFNAILKKWHHHSRDNHRCRQIWIAVPSDPSSCCFPIQKPDARSARALAWEIQGNLKISDSFPSSAGLATDLFFRLAAVSRISSRTDRTDSLKNDTIVFMSNTLPCDYVAQYYGSPENPVFALETLWGFRPWRREQRNHSLVLKK